MLCYAKHLCLFTFLFLFLPPAQSPEREHWLCQLNQSDFAMTSLNQKCYQSLITKLVSMAASTELFRDFTPWLLHPNLPAIALHHSTKTMSSWPLHKRNIPDQLTASLLMSPHNRRIKKDSKHFSVIWFYNFANSIYSICYLCFLLQMCACFMGMRSASIWSAFFNVFVHVNQLLF